MRVVVLGASSMLGTEIVVQLRARGDVAFTAGRSAVHDIEIDLGSGRSWAVPTGVRADVLIHCASSFGGDDPEGTATNLRVNTLGAADALRLADAVGAERIVYAGTIFSIDGVEPAEPARGSYGMSKGEAERILAWGTRGSFCSLRLTHLWDTEGRCCRNQPWLGRMIAYGSRGLALNLPRSEGPRNFLHVVDAARLMVAAAASSLTGCHTATSPVDTDMSDFARAVYATFGHVDGLRIDESKAPFRKIAYPHDNAVFAELDVHPRTDLMDAPALIRGAGTSRAFGPRDVR